MTLARRSIVPLQRTKRGNEGLFVSYDDINLNGRCCGKQTPINASLLFKEFVRGRTRRAKGGRGEGQLFLGFDYSCDVVEILLCVGF